MEFALMLVTLLLTVAVGTAFAQGDNPLLTPDGLTEQAPDRFNVRFETTKGNFVMEVNRTWAPLGADRFYNLVKNGFFDDTGFFRVVPGFVVQFGLNGDPAVNKVWRAARIQDDPVGQSNTVGYVSFATAGPNTRTTQVFINLGNNVRLDDMGFAPFAKVVEGMEVVESITSEYGQRPDQGSITGEGNAYLKTRFPNLDFTTKAVLVE